MIVFKNTDGVELPQGAFELNGSAYPSNWLALATAEDLQAHGITRVELPDPPVVPYVPQVISDRQFFQQLAVQGVITQDEALAAVCTGTLPASLAALVSALPAEQQFGADMLLKGAVQFDRSHPLVPALGQAFGWTAAQLDALWTAAYAL